MFEVEASTFNRLTVRDQKDGHLWTFAVVENAGRDRSLAVCAVRAHPETRHSPNESAVQVQRYAEQEAWKRGLID